MLDFPYGGKCPYDNTEVDCNEGGYVWFCQRGHEWEDYEDIFVSNRCEGTFKYGVNYDLQHSVCQWCGQIVEHIPFYCQEFAGLMDFHLLNQPSSNALEMGESFHVGEHREVIGRVCDGCHKIFSQGQIAEVVVDRLSRRGYMIHRGCWGNLVDTIEGGK